ncbi:sensor histidine kinase [Methylobacterium sp. JK268]
MPLPLSVQKLRRRRWHGYAIGFALFAVAWGVRLALGRTLQGVPFVTFFPAVVAAAVFGGIRAGATTALLTALSAVAAIQAGGAARPVDWPGGLVALGLYFVTTGAVLWVIDALNRTIDALTEERDRSAALYEELQHRVANNLAFVSSLFRLEQRRIAEGHAPDTVEVLERAQGRLDLMARIHRRLHDPDSVRQPLEDLLRHLCADLLEAAGESERVAVTVATPDVAFPLRRLLPLALIVSETVTNALKHAFPEGRRGRIAITLDRAGADYVLTIRDDGRGLPPGLDPAAGRSLGLRIVRSLARQLGGEVEVETGSGVTTRVRFPA